MSQKERLRTAYLFTAIAVCCLLITGCQKPQDVECVDLGQQVEGESIICTDGNEPQVCMDLDQENCGYYVNSQYIPCRSCYECDAVTDFAVALCSGMSRSAESSSINSTR